jgi:very-short-patch-repair endonuclease
MTQRGESKLEALFAAHLRVTGLAAPIREYRFHPKRRWRTDFAWPAEKLLVEIEGGHWSGGRHTRGAGYEKDMEKYNAAVLLGYRVLRFTGRMVREGIALEQTRLALEGDPA